MEHSYALLEAAVSCGSPTRGTELAYDALVRAGLPGLLDDATLYPMEKLEPCAQYPPHLLHLDTVMQVSRTLRANLLTALERRQFPVVVGGDHSIAMGSLAALGEFYGAERLAVIYIDAHADINTERTSTSACIHGMDLAAACGLCCDQLTVGRQKANLLGENLYLLGGRSIDPPEYGILEAQGAHLYPPEMLAGPGLAQVLGEILPRLVGKRVHISFDVDSLDPTQFSSTGYLIPNGLSLGQVHAIVQAVLATGQVCCFECVEYNPTLDATGQDLAHLLEVFSLVRKTLAQLPSPPAL